MKPYIFPIFITILGLLTAYAFYALWHTEEVNIPKIPKQTKEKVIENLSNKEIIPKSVLNVPDVSLETHSPASDEKEMLQMMEKQEDIPNLTPEQMQAQTEAVYDSLTPENHEETMQEANEAFEALDAHVVAMDAKLAEEMEGIEEIQEEINTDTESDEPTEEQNYETMTVPENEEEIDMEYEDVNNP